MRRYRLLDCLLVAALSAVWCSPSSAAVPLTHTEAARHGLKRAWYAQVRLDPQVSRVSHVQFAEKAGSLPDTLFVQTNSGTIQAFDAETGRVLWTRLVGSPDQPTMIVAANQDKVGVLNGTVAYLLDRTTGRIVWRTNLEGVPADGPALNSHRLFVPYTSGRVMAYRLDSEKTIEERVQEAGKPASSAEKQPGADMPPAAAEAAAAKPEPAKSPTPPTENGTTAVRSEELPDSNYPPLTCVSFGLVTSQPIVLQEDLRGETVAWTTTRGVFVGTIDVKREREFIVQFQLDLAGGVVPRAMFAPPTTSDRKDEGILLASSTSGKVFAASARQGNPIWKQPIGSAISEPPIPIGRQVYVATQFNGLYALAMGDGNIAWRSPGLTQFVAAGRERVYVADAAGRIVILDAKDGTRLDAFAAPDATFKFRNIWTDRIYLVTPTGLVQCLHEIETNEPVRHRDVADAGKTPVKPGAKKPGESPFEEHRGGPSPFEETPGTPNPFGTEQPTAPQPANPAVNPFGGEQPTTPKAPAPKAANPFGNE